VTSDIPTLRVVHDASFRSKPEADDFGGVFASARAALWPDELRAREDLERAYGAALTADRPRDARLAAALAVCSYAVHFTDFRGLASWCERFASTDEIASDDSARRLYVLGAKLALPTLGKGLFDDPALDVAAAGLFSGLKSEKALHDDERLALAKLLVEYYLLRHNAHGFQRLILMTAPWLEHAQPLARGVWWLMQANAEQQLGSPVVAESCVDLAREIADTHDLISVQMVLRVESLRACLQAQDLDQSERLLRQIRPLALRLRPGQHRSAMHLEAMDALMRGDPTRAQTLLDLLLAVCEDTEVPQRDRGAYRVYLAYAKLELGDLPGALEALAQARLGQSGAQLQMAECIERLVRAAHALTSGAPDLNEQLRAALGNAAAMKYPMFFSAQPRLAASLVQAAFSAGIETAFVTAAVRKRRLAPPDPLREDWPWTLKLRALGSFTIEREGRVVAFDGKSQKKPLELLKALVAMGGEAIPREVLALTLWPDASADAMKNFDVTLSRLRKLVDIDGALVLAEGKLALSRRLVWWDVVAFEACCARLQTALHDPHAEATVRPLAAELFALYRDKLFGDEPVVAWSAAPRERLALKFNRAVGDVGAWLEARALWREAIDRYERGLAQQMLAEPLYRGLMRCHMALNEPAEALVAYRRCRDLLSILLSVKPSPETEALHQHIRAA